MIISKGKKVKKRRVQDANTEALCKIRMDKEFNHLVELLRWKDIINVNITFESFTLEFFFIAIEDAKSNEESFAYHIKSKDFLFFEETLSKLFVFLLREKVELKMGLFTDTMHTLFWKLLTKSPSDPKQNNASQVKKMQL